MLLTAVALAGCSLPGQAGAGAVTQRRAPVVGSMAPKFSLIGLDGRTHTLAEYRGHVVLINFWATWCIPCRAEIPELESVYRKRAAEGVVFLGIDWKEGKDTILPFVIERQVTYPVLMDSDGRAYTNFQVMDLPKTFVLDKQGRIAVARDGLTTRDRFDAELKAAGA